jgi:hypothetical protein
VWFDVVLFNVAWPNVWFDVRFDVRFVVWFVVVPYDVLFSIV